MATDEARQSSVPPEQAPPDAARDDGETGADTDGQPQATVPGAEPAVRGDVAAGVATADQNAKLEHSQGGTTTRDDAFDMGVPMLPGSKDEPVGPEDALGEGPTRGDYRERIGPDSYQPHTSVVRDGKVVMEAQRPRAEEIGDVEGKKGGVETAGLKAD